MTFIGFAHKNNVTHIVIGKSTRSRWFEIVNGSVVHDLVRRAGHISVHVIAGEDLAEQSAARAASRRRSHFPHTSPCPIWSP